jgi:hypothetical protein
MTVRPTPDQVLSLAPDKAAAAAALAVANPGSWSFAGCDDTAVWGNYVAASAEPYAVAVDLSDDAAGPAYRCTCASRKLPCKHALGLLLLHANDGVARSQRLPFAAQWLQRRKARSTANDANDANVEAQQSRDAHEIAIASHDGGVESNDAPSSSPDGVGVGVGGGTTAPPPDHADIDPARLKRQLERSQRMRAGLLELDRWLADRIRAGLAAPALADMATWDLLAARLIDAQCGGLANRVKRVAGRVGQHARWHEDVLEEIALLHVLAVGALRTSTLTPSLADGVHVATGLTVAKDDVLAGVPSTARWIVGGVSRTREDRITVQRTWLCSVPSSHQPSGATTWAMVLSFGAFGNEVTYEYHVGTAFDADLHWYPGGIALRALVGRQHNEPIPFAGLPPCTTIAAGLAACGWAIAREPWLERFPMCVSAVPTRAGSSRWALTDSTGSLVLAAGFAKVAELVCSSAGAPVTVMGEWSTDGFLPLTLWCNELAVML